MQLKILFNIYNITMYFSYLYKIIRIPGYIAQAERFEDGRKGQ